MISRRFIKSSIIYTFAGALPMASAIVLLPFYIEHLSTALYGILSIYLAFSLFVQIVVTFSFDTSVYVHYHELKNNPSQLGRFLSSSFIIILAIGAGAGALLAILGDLIFEALVKDKDISFFPYGVAAIASGIFQAVFKVHSSLLQTREQPLVFFWSNLLSFTLIALFTIGGLFLFPATLVGPIFGRLLAVGICAAWCLLRIFRAFGVHFDFTWLKESFSFNAYTFIYQIQQWVINYFDRFLLLFYLSFHTVGVYDFAMKCLIPVELVLNSLYNSFYPKVVSTIIDQTEKKSTPEINRYYHGLNAIVMLLICMGIILLPWAVELFVSKPAYHEGLRYVPYLAVLYVFRSIRLFFAAPYSILKYTKPLSGIYFSISALKILLIVLLIDTLDVYAVILASGVSAVVELFLLRHGIASRFTFKFNMFKIIWCPLLLLCLIVIFELFIETSNDHLIHLGYFAACCLLLWWTYRREIPLLNPLGKGYTKK